MPPQTQPQGDWVDDLLKPSGASAPTTSSSPAPLAGDWVDDLLSTPQPAAAEPSFWDKAKTALYGPKTVAGQLLAGGKRAEETGETIPAFRDPLSFGIDEETAAAPAPSLETLGRLHEATGAAPVAPSEFVPRTSPRLKATAEVGESLLSPENAALMYATGGLGTAGRVSVPLVSRALGGLFSVQQFSSIPEELSAASEAEHRGDTDEATRLRTHALYSGLFGLLGARHAYKGGPAPPAERLETAEPQPAQPAALPAPEQAAPLAQLPERRVSHPEATTVLPTREGTAVPAPSGQPQLSEFAESLRGAKPATVGADEGAFFNEPNANRLRRELGPAAATLPSSITEPISVGSPEDVAAARRAAQLPSWLRSVVPERALGLPERLAPQVAEPEKAPMGPVGGIPFEQRVADQVNDSQFPVDRKEALANIIRGRIIWRDMGPTELAMLQKWAAGEWHKLNGDFDQWLGEENRLDDFIANKNRPQPKPQVGGGGAAAQLPESLAPQAAEPATEQPRSDLSTVDRSKVPGGKVVDPRSLDIDFDSHPFMMPDDVEKAKERIARGEQPSAIVKTDPQTGRMEVVDGHGSAWAALETGTPIRAIEASNIEGEGEAVGTRVMSHYGGENKPEVTAEIADDPTKKLLGQDSPTLQRLHDRIAAERSSVFNRGLEVPEARRGEVVPPLHPEEHAELERRAGQTLTPEQAQILRQRELETQTNLKLASSQPPPVDEVTAIREPNRAALERQKQTAVGTMDPAAETVSNLHKQNGGATFSLTHGDLNGRDMYAVGAHPDRTETLPRAPSPEEVQSFIERNQDLLSRPDRSIGTWAAPDGRHVLDVVATVPDEKEAMRIATEGRAKPEESIYHLGGKGEIKVPEKPVAGGLGAVPAAGGAGDWVDQILQGKTVPDVETVAPGATALNAAGESAASLEAVSRERSEAAQGITRWRVDTRSGREVPLRGVDAVDAKPGPYDLITMRDASGRETVLDQGKKAFASRPRQPGFDFGSERGAGSLDFLTFLSTGGLSEAGRRVVEGLRKRSDVEGWPEIAKFLPKADRDNASRRLQQLVVDAVSKFGDPKMIEEAAKAGSVARGWYSRTARLLKFTFGRDADQFVDFVASTSPMKSVEQNFVDALGFYAEWVKAGRPTGRENARLIRSILPDKVGAAGSVIREQLYNQLVNGVSPSGPKVSNFAQNLRGELKAITKDRWMAYLFGQSERLFQAKSARLGVDATIRAVGKKLNMLPAEVQESGWSFLRTVLNLSEEKGVSPSEAARTVTEADIRAGASEFTALIASDEKVRGALDALADATGNERFRVRNIERSRRYQQLVGEARRTRGVAGGLAGADRDVLANVAERAAAARSGVTEEVKPTLAENLVKKYGTTDDPLKAGFILADGRMVRMGAGVEHDTMLDLADPREAPFKEGAEPKNREEFINSEGAIRTGYRQTRAGNEVFFSVPEKGVSPEQLEKMRASVGRMGRYGNMVMEVANSEKNKSFQKEFALPSDVDDAARKLGVHPDVEARIVAPTAAVALKVKPVEHPYITAAKKTFGVKASFSEHDLGGWILPEGKIIDDTHAENVSSRGHGFVEDLIPDKQLKKLHAEDYPQQLENVVRHFGSETGSVRVAGLETGGLAVQFSRKNPPTDAQLAFLGKYIRDNKPDWLTVQPFDSIRSIFEKTSGVLPGDIARAFQSIKESPKSFLSEVASGRRASANPIDTVTRLYTDLVGKKITAGINDLYNAALGHIDVATGLPVKRGLRSPESFLPRDYLKAKTAAEASIETGARGGLKLGQRLSDKLSQHTQQILMDVVSGRTNPNQLNVVRNTPRLQDAIDAAKAARVQLDDLGAQAVAQKLLRSQDFFRNYGKYVPRLYRKYEVDYDALLNSLGERRPNRLEFDRFRKRADIPALVRAQMGEITEAAYPVARGIADLTHDVALSKLFSKVAVNPSWASDTPRPGWIQMPETFKLGDLSGKYVDRDLARDINEMIQTKSEASKFFRDLMGRYKRVRVVWAPASFVWHNLSRTTLNYLDGLPPYRVDIYAKALIDRTKEGPLYQRALKAGVIHQQALDPETYSDLIDSWNKSQGSLTRRVMQMGAELMANLQKGKDYEGDFWNHPYWTAAREFKPLRAATGGKSDKVTQLYSALDDWMKMAKFAHNLEKGMPEYEAGVDARKATIDYRHVPKMVDWGRRTITPFITFPSQALPRLAKSAIEAPWRLLILYYLINSFQENARKQLGLSQEEEDRARRLSQPHAAEGSGLNESVGGFQRYILLPHRDVSNRLQFMDMNHLLHWTGVGTPPAPGMLPFGSERAAGPLSLPAEILQREVYGNPVVSMFGPVMFNKDPYTGKALYGPGEQHEGPMGALGERVWRTWTPSLAPGNVGFNKVVDTARGRPDYFGKPTDLPTTLFSQSTGINVRPFDQSTEEFFRNKEFKEAMEDIKKGIYRLNADQRLDPTERDKRLKELEARRDALVQRYSELYSGKR